MNNKTFTKTYASTTAPNPKMNILWMDLTADPYGSVLKYWNGSTWKEADANLDSPAFTGTPTINGNEISTVPDNGTNYVMVYGLGTPTENAAELQAAYEEAKNMPRYLGEFTSTELIQLYKGQTYAVDRGGTSYLKMNVDRLTDPIGADSEFIDGPNSEYVATVIPTEAEAKSVRTTVVVAPGDYHFTDTFMINTLGVNVVSLTGNADINIKSDDNNGICVHITAPVFVKGFNMVQVLKLAGDLTELVCEDCVATGEYSFSSMGDIENLKGTFKNCTGGDYSWNTDGFSILCNCYNCSAGIQSFGYNSGLVVVLGGYYENCSAINRSFYVLNPTCVLKNCKVRETGDSSGESFYGNGVNDGIFIGCQCPAGEVWSPTSSGHITYCINGDGSAAANV